MPELKIAIYGPDESQIATITLTYDELPDPLDVPGDVTEKVVEWCSENGYTYDNCDWEYLV